MNQPSAATETLRHDVNAAQRTASNPHGSVWVGASAGSGKTKVLADRVTRLLLDGVRPEKILCLTFTRAAAAEMSIRLAARLSHWASCEDATLEKELDALQNHPPNGEQRDRARRLFAQVLNCPGGMRLQTIHGFAQEVLRRFPIEAGLAPHFTVMEEIAAQTLQQDVFTDWLHSIALGQEEPQITQAFACLSCRMAESSLHDLLLDIRKQAAALHRAAHQAGGFEKMIAACYARLDLAPFETEHTLLQGAAKEGGFDRASLLVTARLMAEKGATNCASVGRAILDWLAKDEDARLKAWPKYEETFLTQKGTIRTHLPDGPTKKAAPDTEAVFMAEAQRVLAIAQKRETLTRAQETEAVLRLGLRLAQAYAERKEQSALLDYDDLIEKACALLSSKEEAAWVLYKLDGGIDHLLVDEAQDTSPAQWRIVQCLAEEYFSGQSARDDVNRTLFVVGDEKQSIYSFLGADPGMFESMRHDLAQKIIDAKKPFEEVPLNVSFRSAPAVLRAVDAVFAQDAVRHGVSHTAVEHAAFRQEAAGRVEVWPLYVPPPQEESDEPATTETKKKSGKKEPADWALPLGYETAQDPAAELATRLAQQIRQWVASGQTVYDRALGRNRAMTYGDVMVLIQRRNAFVYHLVRALKKEGVEVSGVDRLNLTRQLAVMDLAALLRFALLPEDDLTLACVLRGPLIGASEDDLMTLAIGRTGSLWAQISKAAQEEPARFAVWHSYLQHIANNADRIPPLPLLIKILCEPCPADAVSGRRAIAARLGPDAEDPIDELLSVAEAFGAQRAPSLQLFLHELFAADVMVKREMEQPAGRVRITTVHASKGLEAPIVILPDTLTAPDRGQLDKILWDKQNQLPFYIPRQTSNAFLSSLREEALVLRREEHRRLLYVAMTRAADRLYIGGYVAKNKKENDGAVGADWYSPIVAGLSPLHQEDVPVDPESVLKADIVLADIAHIPTLRAATPNKTGAEKQERTALPAWLLRPPPEEPLPPRPLIPSRPSEAEEAQEPASLSPRDARFARGRLIHRLLQNLPDLAADKREAAARRFLAQPAHGLPQEAQAEIAQEVLRLLEDTRFAPLFGPASRAEQPLIGISGERLIAGQMDRLALVGEEVWVVDYKTNRPPPADPKDIPAPYRAQMEAYRRVLTALYPARRIRCFLLWTYTPCLMEV